jgi:hypothetical protein
MKLSNDWSFMSGSLDFEALLAIAAKLNHRLKGF